MSNQGEKDTEALKGKKKKIRPFAKMIARYYMANGWIDPELASACNALMSASSDVAAFNCCTTA